MKLFDFGKEVKDEEVDAFEKKLQTDKELAKMFELEKEFFHLLLNYGKNERSKLFEESTAYQKTITRSSTKNATNSTNQTILKLKHPQPGIEIFDELIVEFEAPVPCDIQIKIEDNQSETKLPKQGDEDFIIPKGEVKGSFLIPPLSLRMGRYYCVCFPKDEDMDDYVIDPVHFFIQKHKMPPELFSK